MNLRRVFSVVAQWFDTQKPLNSESDQLDWFRILPFLGMHLACLAIIWVSVSWVAVIVCAIMYSIRMFAITGFYHRYFSHRSFKTSRIAQFIFAVLGAAAVQRGPLWWAAHHRHHHAHSDQPNDVHSPRQQGFWWAHMGWFLSRQHFHSDRNRVKDLSQFWELRFIDRFDLVVPVSLATGLFFLGHHFYYSNPQWHTNGAQMLIWGFFVSTVLCYHATYTINSLAHVFGRRRYETRDDSRNNWLLALLTFGEGWHNNHHYYPNSARQGFTWWEVDLTYYTLKLLSLLGIVWDLKPAPVVTRQSR
jgi:stearoyl-CoA desaturase (Delta-9 desaturase)